MAAKQSTSCPKVRYCSQKALISGCCDSLDRLSEIWGDMSLLDFIVLLSTVVNDQQRWRALIHTGGLGSISAFNRAPDCDQMVRVVQCLRRSQKRRRTRETGLTSPLLMMKQSIVCDSLDRLSEIWGDMSLLDFIVLLSTVVNDQQRWRALIHTGGLTGSISAFNIPPLGLSEIYRINAMQMMQLV